MKRFIVCSICRIRRTVLMCIKTRSLLFLLAYTIFTIYSLFAYKSWDEWTSQRIIHAIVITGALFSVAELFYTLHEIKVRHYAYSQELLAISIKAIRDLSEEVDFQENRVRRAQNYFASNPNYHENDIPKTIEEYQDLIENLKETVEKLGKQKSEESIIGNIIMVIGMLAFFILVTTDISSVFSQTMGDLLTIAAFSVVMITYYIKQVCFINSNEELGEMKYKVLMGEKLER